MTQPFNVQANGNTAGPGVAGVDKAGNTTVAGTLTAAGGVVYVATRRSAPPAVPGQLGLWSADGVNLQLAGAGGQAGAAFVAAPVTVTGTTAASPLITLPLPSSELAAGQHYRVTCSGVITTTVDTQTLTFAVDVGATAVLSLSGLNPDSTGTLTNAPWAFEADIFITAGLKGGGWGNAYFNFFLNGNNQAPPTGVSSSSASISLQVTPSDNAVSITVQQGEIRRVS